MRTKTGHIDQFFVFTGQFMYGSLWLVNGESCNYSIKYLKRHSVKYDHDIGVAIHARVLIARFGKRAREDAENHAKKLKKSGDKDGYEVWMKVAKHIKRNKS